MNKQDLDRHITGNYGEDSVADEVPVDTREGYFVIRTHVYVRLLAQAKKSQARSRALRALNEAYLRLAGARSGVALIHANEALRDSLRAAKREILDLERQLREHNERS